jgi:hypothetical protein
MNDYDDDYDDDYEDDEDFINAKMGISFTSDNWKEIAEDDMGIIMECHNWVIKQYEIQNDYVMDTYEGPFLVIGKEYNDFNICFNESKDGIYRKMLDVYENIKNLEYNDLNSDEFNLCVIATIDGSTFNTNFPINKISSIEIKTVIIPHFEKIEDYEACDRALKLYNQINR